MSEQFPIFRLATLLARQLSSPIATRIKEYAKGHPRFGRSVCMRGGRAAAAVELRFKMWSLQLRPSSAPLAALTDARALDAGADLLGEMILFSFGAAIVTYEVNRQAIKQEEKTAAERARRQEARRQAEELQLLLRDQQRRLHSLAAVIASLHPSTLTTSSEPATPPAVDAPPAPRTSDESGVPPVVPAAAPVPETSRRRQETTELCPCQPTTDPLL